MDAVKWRLLEQVSRALVNAVSARDEDGAYNFCMAAAAIFNRNPGEQHITLMVAKYGRETVQQWLDEVP
jgi:hypothetical protein